MKFKLSPFLWLLGVYILVSLIFSFQLGLTEQEAYYWLWSKHLDWSYYDHPPLQAWITALLTAILGDEKWVVRLPALIGDLATLFLFYHFVKIKRGEKVAQFCSLLLVSSSAFIMGSVVALPDSFAVPLGLAVMISAVSGKVYRTALLLGLALIAKWTVLFIVPGVAYALYRQKKLTIQNILTMGLIVLVMQSPVIWWNWQNGAVSFKFHLYGRHNHHVLSTLAYVRNAFDFVVAQIFSLGLLTSALIATVAYRLSKDKFQPSIGEIHWPSLFFWTAPGLLIVAVSALQGQIRFYWTFLNLLPVVAMAGYLAYHYFPERIEALKKAAVAFIVFQWTCGFVAGFYPIGTRVQTALNLKEDLRMSPMGELSGWREWYDETIVPKGFVDQDTAIIGSDLHVASRLSWTLRKERDLSSIGVAGESGKNQFMFWPNPEPPRYKKALFFGDNRHDHMDDFDMICGHRPKWITTPSKAYNYTYKNIYWAECTELKKPYTQISL